MKRIGWLMLVAGCGSPDVLTGQDRVDAILKLEGDAGSGAEVFASHCAQCHGDDGSALDGDYRLGGIDIRGWKADAVVDAVVSPKPGMLTFRTMPDQEIADVAAHVTEL